MEYNKIQDTIKEVEKELLDLKGPQGAINYIMSYSAVSDSPSYKMKITYSDGVDDIITRVYLTTNDNLSLADAFLVRPIGNEQIVYTHGSPSSILVLSTRPIISIESVL